MKIVIGSVLKPLTDVRHYHKIALSLLKIPGLQVYILARNETNLPVKESLHFKFITPFKVSVVSRISAPYIFFIYLFKIEPQAIIVCTHELLLPALFYKWIKGCVLIYDIQENYKLNIISNSTYNPLIKRLLAFSVRLKEQIVTPFINLFWLAEVCYKTELPFVSDKYEIFENKSIVSKDIQPVSFRNKESVRLIFSGTIAKENGVEEAIILAEKLHKLDPKYSLSIIGCCHDVNLFFSLEKTAKLKSFIILHISLKPVNYESIIKEIQNSDIGIISYKQQENFKNKVPTKLYEYLSLGLPVLITKNNKWEEIGVKYNAALIIDFKDYEPETIHQKLRNHVFYLSSNINSEELTWNSDQTRFINSFHALLPK